MKTRKLRRGSSQLRTTVGAVVLTLSLLIGSLCSHAQQIACGQTMNGSISSGGETDTYTFNANAGETVTILILGQTINAVVEVYNPSNARIGGATNNFTGPINLTSTGTYSIRVHADNSSATGAYGVSLTFLTGRCGTPLVWGPPATSTVGSLAEVDSYTFHGNAGESVVINTASTNLTAAAFVAGPNGVIIDNWVSAGGGTVTLSNLTSSGTYTVGVYSFYIGGTGTYTLSLFFSKLVPASFRLAIGKENGAAALTIWGEVGRQTTVKYTTDVGTSPQASPPVWSTLTNFSLPWSPYRLVDWGSANSARRFYRTVQ